MFPTYRGTPWPLWQLRIGVKLYDLLCGGRNLGPSSSMTAAEVQAHLPGIRATGLTGGVRYFDGLTNDARLVIDTLRSAARHGAIVCNYTRFESALADRGDVALPARATCRPTAPIKCPRERVVNATGPWAPMLVTAASACG